MKNSVGVAYVFTSVFGQKPPIVSIMRHTFVKFGSIIEKVNEAKV
jgi:hypothetical protein